MGRAAFEFPPGVYKQVTRLGYRAQANGHPERLKPPVVGKT